MSYTADVFNDPKWVKIWQNFINLYWVHSEYSTINECLDAWNACDIHDTPYIEFRSDNDALLFLLKWS